MPVFGLSVLNGIRHVDIKFVYSHVEKDFFFSLAKGIYTIKQGTDLKLTLIMFASLEASY